MKTFKVAGTLRVPSARGQRPRQFTNNTRRHPLRGGRHIDHASCACHFICLTLLTGCGLEGPVPSGPKTRCTGGHKHSGAEYRGGEVRR